MVGTGKPQLLVGDFNFCYLDRTSNTYLQNNNFKQLIEEPTHEEGNLLDHAYLRDTNMNLNCKVMLHSKYYTDHKGLSILIHKGKYEKNTLKVQF